MESLAEQIQELRAKNAALVLERATLRDVIHQRQVRMERMKAILAEKDAELAERRAQLQKQVEQNRIPAWRGQPLSSLSGRTAPGFTTPTTKKQS